MPRPSREASPYQPGWLFLRPSFIKGYLLGQFLRFAVARNFQSTARLFFKHKGCVIFLCERSHKVFAAIIVDDTEPERRLVDDFRRREQLFARVASVAQIARQLTVYILPGHGYVLPIGIELQIDIVVVVIKYPLNNVESGRVVVFCAQTPMVAIKATIAIMILPMVITC